MAGGGGLIDVSVALREGMTTWPGDPAFTLARVADIADGDQATLSAVSMGLHSGTHVDAPAHFVVGGATIDKAPLDALIGHARVIGIMDQDAVTREELAGHGIVAGERILLKTRNSLLWEQPAFTGDFVPLTEEAARYLADCRVRCVGIDYLSVGPKGGGAAVHVALLEADVWVLEGLDLRAVEPGAYDMVCAPLRIEGAEASPVRALLRPR